MSRIVSAFAQKITEWEQPIPRRAFPPSLCTRVCLVHSEHDLETFEGHLPHHRAIPMGGMHPLAQGPRDLGVRPTSIICKVKFGKPPNARQEGPE